MMEKKFYDIDLISGLGWQDSHQGPGLTKVLPNPANMFLEHGPDED